MKQFLVERLLRNPYPVYSAMRRFAPVFHDRRHKLWMLFDFESVRAVLGDAQTFSSRAAPPGEKPLDWLIFLDPPLHTKLRGLVMRSFTPAAIAGLVPSIEERVEALIAPARARGAMDVVTEFAEPLPVMVIADLLGLPPHDYPRLRRWADAILGLSNSVAGGELAARSIHNFREAKDEMRPYVLELVAQRRANPANDLLTRLVQAEVDGEQLTDEDILGFFYLLLLAGSETTTNLIANAMLCRLHHPRAFARLGDDPLPMIEEVLRYHSPVQMVFRTTTREVTMRGKTIPMGSLVLAFIGSANRDPRQFKNAGTFDLTRPASHIAFGHGAHFCIGAMLARLEAKIALPKLLALKNVRLKEWKPRTALAVHGPRTLRVTFDA